MAERPNMIIKGFPADLKDAIKIIAKNQGISMSAFIKTKMREIVNSCPDHMKVKHD